MTTEVDDRPIQRIEADTQGAPELQLSVVVPAYREGKRIHNNLLRLLSELDNINVPYEVIVVSDGNTDDTASQARSIKSPRLKVFDYPMNVGKGFALSLGVHQSR